MQIIDNITNTLKDDLQVTIKRGSKVSIAAACFSIYAYSIETKNPNASPIRKVFGLFVCGRPKISRK